MLNINRSIFLIKLNEYNKIPDVCEACWQIGISPDNKFLALSFYSQPNTVQLCDLNGKVLEIEIEPFDKKEIDDNYNENDQNNDDEDEKEKDDDDD